MAFNSAPTFSRISALLLATAMVEMRERSMPSSMMVEKSISFRIASASAPWEIRRSSRCFARERWSSWNTMSITAARTSTSGTSSGAADPFAAARCTPARPERASFSNRPASLSHNIGLHPMYFSRKREGESCVPSPAPISRKEPSHWSCPNSFMNPSSTPRFEKYRSADGSARQKALLVSQHLPMRANVGSSATASADAAPSVSADAPEYAAAERSVRRAVR
mmetsp:Transcript_60253/g.143149  ORF Transcript_60253/g.143149 Transcript_60253/m.143149 type:complete len:223 (-) Transcript_60253:45-713(-)